MTPCGKNDPLAATDWLTVGHAIALADQRFCGCEALHAARVAG